MPTKRDTADPLAGGEYIERLTDDTERGATEYIACIDAMGGTSAAIESNYIQSEIQNAARLGVCRSARDRGRDFGSFAGGVWRVPA